MVGPAAKREAVAHLQAELGLSERRACSIAGADRTMVRYRSCRPPDTELRARLRELANERRRFTDSANRQSVGELQILRNAA
jgi:putative transposase